MPHAPVPSALTQLPLSEEDRPRYSVAELHDYFNRIGLPQKYLDSPLLSDKTYAATKQHGLPFLQALTRHHTCNVPFENLELHYSAHKTITLNVADLYAKIVRQRRGGRCMENNTFFGTVLRSLGYEVRNCGGRVSRAMSPFPEVRRNQGTTYDGWNHMLNLVRLDGEWYVVDVGMGAMGPNLPYPLQDGFETASVAPRRIRIQLRSIAESYAGQSNTLWCYDVCYNSVDNGESVWVPVYCFTETEFLPQDYEIMSWFTSTHERSFFTRYVTSTRMLMDEAREEIVGSITLFEATIKQSIGSERKVLKECTTEDERVDALKEFFGIELTDEERKGIPPDLRLG
ncbi:arylamine N-acetyltransferase 1 [Macrophomina phaseolina]|uniref:Arylamine N-acetyltransferase 1 n=1 Tax=Macrophomina phaseolina TaxID=35725 RepID=A0ABQ8FXP8_9PEZI|nr:arylamine N-acetyltransferase 1 [Macrophomina phaseolina]